MQSQQCVLLAGTELSRRPPTPPPFNCCSSAFAGFSSLLPSHSIMLRPNFDFHHIKFSHVALLPLPGQSSRLYPVPTADTGLQGWLNRNYTHLALGHSSTRATYKAATVHSTHPALQLLVSAASVLENS